MKKKTYIEIFHEYKKHFFLIFLLAFLSLSICTFIMNKNLIRKRKEKIIQEFKNIVDLFDKKKYFSIQNQNLFYKKQKCIYTSLIGINLSKRYFLKKDYEKAIIILNDILSSTSEENLRNFIKLNLVKIYIKNKQFSLALKIINNIHDNEWSSIFQKYKKKYIL